MLPVFALAAAVAPVPQAWCAGAEMIHRVTIEYHDGQATGALGLTSGRGHYDAGDRFYEPRLTTAFNLSRSVYGDGATAGRSKVGVGAIVAANADGGLDHVKGYGFDGRRVLVEASASESGPWRVVFTGTVEQAEFTYEEAVFRLRDRLAELEVPVQDDLVTGGDQSAEGSPRPLALGEVLNVTPLMIDAAGLVCQVHDGPIQAVDSVYDSGVRLGLNILGNGGFSDESSWKLMGDFAIIGGKARLDAFPDAYDSLSQEIHGFSPGAYTVSLDIDEITGSGSQQLIVAFYYYDAAGELIYSTPASSGVFTTPGSHSYSFDNAPGNVAKARIAIKPVSTYSLVIDNVSVAPKAVDHPTRGELDGADIPPGGYHTCLSHGLIRLGGSPAGRITADVTGARNLSPQLVQSPDFADPAGAGESWSAGQGWSVTGGAAAKAPGSASSLSQEIGARAGARYLVSFDVAGMSAGSLTPAVGGVTGEPVSLNGGQVREIVAAGTGPLDFAADADFDGGLDNIDVWEVEPLARTSVAPLMELLLLSKGFLAADEIDQAAVAALDALNPGRAGIYVNSSTDLLEVLDELAGSIGAWYGFSRGHGRFVCGRFEIPEAGEKLDWNLDDYALQGGAVERLPTTDQGKGVPAWRVNLRHTRNFTLQESDLVGEGVYVSNNLAGSVSNERRAFLSREWRVATASDEAVREVHLLAPEMTFASLLTQNAEAEAARLLAIYSLPRDRFKLTVPASELFDPEAGMELDLGDCLRLTSNRFGLEEGKRFMVIGLTEVYGKDLDTVELDIYG